MAITDDPIAQAGLIQGSLNQAAERSQLAAEASSRAMQDAREAASRIVDAKVEAEAVLQVVGEARLLLGSLTEDMRKVHGEFAQYRAAMDAVVDEAIARSERIEAALTGTENAGGSVAELQRVRQLLIGEAQEMGQSLRRARMDADMLVQRHVELARVMDEMGVRRVGIQEGAPEPSGPSPFERRQAFLRRGQRG